MAALCTVRFHLTSSSLPDFPVVMADSHRDVFNTHLQHLLPDGGFCIALKLRRLMNTYHTGFNLVVHWQRLIKRNHFVKKEQGQIQPLSEKTPIHAMS